jgi:hypothetical protein
MLVLLPNADERGTILQEYQTGEDDTDADIIGGLNEPGI